MLYLTRKIGESIIIGNETVVTVMEVKGKKVKLGFSSPEKISILRYEVYSNVSEQNKLAAQALNIEDIEQMKNINIKQVKNDK